MSVETDAELPAGTDAPEIQANESAQVETEETGSEEQGTEGEGQEGESSTPKPRGVQKRLDELTKNWRSAERERDHWRELAMRSFNQEKQAPPEIPPPSKSLADFNFDESAYAKYLIEHATSHAEKVALERAKEQEQRQKATERLLTYKSKAAEFAKNAPDFDQVAHNPDLPITDAMAEVIQQSDDGPALAYYLGKNPDIAYQISRLPPTLAAKELGRIEGVLSAKKEAVKPKKVSEAPPPPNRLSGSEPAIEKDPDKMTAEEWLKWREKQLAKKR
jgi:hypothetical protein